MKEFKCKDLGNACNEGITARTEERLAELISIHLRETHGMATLSQDMTARIKNLFINHASADAAKVVDRIFEKYNCDAEPECTWRYIAEAEMILTGGKPAHERELRAA